MEFEKLFKRFNEINEQYLLWQACCEFYIQRAHQSCLNSKDSKKISIVADPKSVDKESIIHLRNCFSRAIDFFETNEKSDQSNELLSEIAFTWANIETFLFKDKQEMNKIMEKYVRLNGNKPDSWIKYINLEL